MNLTPQRKHGESFGAYRRRRAAENEAVEAYLNRRVYIGVKPHRPKYGKAETKRRKRARQAQRRGPEPCV